MSFCGFVWAVYLASWAVWVYIPVFRAPHGQKRASITAKRPTQLGIALETASYFAALVFHTNYVPSWPRLVAVLIAGPLGVLLMWKAVAHLGRQFRINAGLWEDHELVRTGPYAIVRHPIYASMLLMLAATAMLVTRPWWMLVVFAMFLAGTEIRVHTEDGLLKSRFGGQFDAYRRSVSAYVPFVR